MRLPLPKYSKETPPHLGYLNTCGRSGGAIGGVSEGVSLLEAASHLAGACALSA